MYDGACPYMTDDRYPVWKVQDVDHAESGDDIEAVTLSKEEDYIIVTRNEPEPSLDVETEPQADVVDDDALTAKGEMPMEQDLSVIEEDDKPTITLREIQAEIMRMEGPSRKKLKTWIKKIGMEPTFEVTEAQPEDWVHTFD